MAWRFGQQPSWEENDGMNYMNHPLATPGVGWCPTAGINEPTPVQSPDGGTSFPTYLISTPSGGRVAFRGPFLPDGATRQNMSLHLRDQPAAITSPPSPRDSSASGFVQASPEGPRLAVGETSRQRRNSRTLSQRNNRTANSQRTTPLQCKWEGCRYLGEFQRVSELIRHIRTLHITPLDYPCPVPGCDKICNREDNLLQHMRTRHHLR
ncbi:hypothetical protein P168DRAFT_279406 [Aspergillus campestris IBT 28561]|uniref:C2H2-type domain-containing protein n=1 Tax=Aspergillus campestris (strain IBT 28561) TaxID=1392248 RepID=A0A2I1DC30_ASPC2|nr:uncharacterized protein P168DRAFT_279406 [Aspergillus campestris IBT 28561]PKY07437.1 hypothetical protein P168DRAFT_279406 [Aspergillus campestris IBT 28561]